MRKIWGGVLISLFLASCAPIGVNVEGAEKVADLSKKALQAYRNGNEVVWRSLICGADKPDAPLSGWRNMRSLVGDISNIHLVSISSKSGAGIAGDRYLLRQIAYEVTASKYLGGRLLLIFLDYKNSDCVGLLY